MTKKLLSFLRSKREHLVFISYSVLVIFHTFISYGKINNLFYLSDEFIALGNVYVHGIFAGLNQFSIIDLLLGRGRPFGSLLINSFYYYWPYNITPFVITAYIFHILNGILLYRFINKISKSTFISFISGIFFVTASAGNQTITWIANITQVPIATSFILLSCLLIIKFFEINKRKYVLYSILCGYIAFLFKDQFFYVFIWLPALYILMIYRQNTVKNLFKKYWYFLILFFAIMNYKLFLFNGINLTTLGAGPVSYLIKAAFNWFYYPLISLSQTFIPPEYMFKIARQFLYFNYGNLLPYINNIDAITTNIISDLLSLILSFLFLIFVATAYLLNKPQRKTIVISIIFYLLSFSTIAVFLIDRNTSYVESRYLYTGMISMGIFFAVIVDTVKIILFKTKIPKVISIICILSILVLWFGKQITLIQREVNRSVINGQNAKHVLDELTTIVPILPDKPIIYLTGNSTYYGYPNHYVPLQLDPGYIFMVWYYRGGKIPKDLIIKNTLSSFGTQWYQEYGDKAFGYYWDKEKLTEVIKEKNIGNSQIIGLYYDRNTQKFMNITDELRSELFYR